MVESESRRVLRRRALDHLAEDRPKAGKSAAGGSTMTPPQYIPNPTHRARRPPLFRSNIHTHGYVRIITSSASSEDPPPNIPFSCLIASSKPIIPVHPRARARRPLPSNLVLEKESQPSRPCSNFPGTQLSSARSAVVPDHDPPLIYPNLLNIPLPPPAHIPLRPPFFAPDRLNKV